LQPRKHRGWRRCDRPCRADRTPTDGRPSNREANIVKQRLYRRHNFLIVITIQSGKSTSAHRLETVLRWHPPQPFSACRFVRYFSIFTTASVRCGVIIGFPAARTSMPAGLRPGPSVTILDQNHRPPPSSDGKLHHQARKQAGDSPSRSPCLYCKYRTTQLSWTGLGKAFLVGRRHSR
jgi:hypothetical protein